MMASNIKVDTGSKAWGAQSGIDSDIQWNPSMRYISEAEVEKYEKKEERKLWYEKRRK